LPLRLPYADEPGEQWACSGCGSRYLGVLDETCPSKIRGNARPIADIWAENAAKRQEKLSARRTEYQSQGAAKKAPVALSGLRSSLQTTLTRSLDRELEQATDEGLRPQGVPFAARLLKRPKGVYSEELVHNLIELLDTSTNQVGQMFSALKRGRPADVAQAESIARGALEQATADIDLFVSLGIQPPAGDYPSRHSLHVSMLAMSIGAMLNWDAETLAHLGMGCLLHDVGMLRVPAERYGKQRMFAEIANHPIYTLDLLEKHLDRLSREARLVAYQVHERLDGSGYPRGASGVRVHEFARVAAVADTFVALSTPRPHRPALAPYHAMETILHGAKTGLYDPNVVRALLATVSLFPLGSQVILSDGQTARVLRANQDQYVRPIVEVRPGASTGAGTIIDLAQESKLSIVAVASDAAGM
jgi:HD-GYP domain-containing protein (c-di-GMP phosphodiesterase class II)